MAQSFISFLKSDMEKLERFDGSNYRRWQQKIHLLLIALGVTYVLTTPKLLEE